MKEFTIKRNEENQRLDKYLKKLLPNASTGFLYKMLRKKNICCNEKKADGSELLHAGDTITVFFSDETFLKFSADTTAQDSEFERLRELPSGGLCIVYEDADILIADKPFNMLSQKAAPEDISANEYLLGYLIRSGKLSMEDFHTFRPSVCNRLDRNTTGLLLMGVSLKGSQELSRMLKERTVQKYYLAVVAGTVTEKAHVKGYLVKDETTNTVTIVKIAETGEAVNKGSRTRQGHLTEQAVETAYEPLAWDNGTTLLKVHLLTGKTHQIRAQLSSAGHPIIGDPKYGDASVNKMFREKYGIRAQLLHAYCLVFPDKRRFIAPMPDAFLKVSRKYREAENLEI